MTCRISKLESSALTSLRDMLIASQLQLLPEFQKFDKDGNGKENGIDIGVLKCNKDGNGKKNRINSGTKV